MEVHRSPLKLSFILERLREAWMMDRPLESRYNMIFAHGSQSSRSSSYPDTATPRNDL